MTVLTTWPDVPAGGRATIGRVVALHVERDQAAVPADVEGQRRFLIACWPKVTTDVRKMVAGNVVMAARGGRTCRGRNRKRL